MRDEYASCHDVIWFAASMGRNRDQVAGKAAQMGLVRSAGRVKRRPVAYEPMCQPWMPVQSVVMRWAAKQGLHRAGEFMESV